MIFKGLDKKMIKDDENTNVNNHDKIEKYQEELKYKGQDEKDGKPADRKCK